MDNRRTRAWVYQSPVYVSLLFPQSVRVHSKAVPHGKGSYIASSFVPCVETHIYGGGGHRKAGLVKFSSTVHILTIRLYQSVLVIGRVSAHVLVRASVHLLVPSMTLFQEYQRKNATRYTGGVEAHETQKKTCCGQ